MVDSRKNCLQTVDGVIFAGEGDEMSLLVVKRRYPPYEERWALPGGFVEHGESPLLAVIREVEEETGVKLFPIKATPLRSRGMEGRDPRGWTITIPFHFHLDQKERVQLSDESLEVKWVPLNDLESLAFDHGAIVCEALSLYWPILNRSHLPYRGFKSPSYPFSEVTFFGGTFYPWHQGHLTCVDLYPSKEKLIVIPDRNPFKKESNDTCAWQHYRSIQQKLSHYPCWVYPGFCGLEFPNPTMAWASSLKIPFSLLMGDDCFIQLPRWIKVEELLPKVKDIWVVPRMGEKSEYRSIEKWRDKVAPSLVIHYLDEHPYQTLSSTAMKKRN